MQMLQRLCTVSFPNRKYGCSYPVGVFYLPINTRDVDNDIDHITAELIGLHIHWGTISCNINFTDHVKEKCLFNSRILKQKDNAILKGQMILEHVITI